MQEFKNKQEKIKFVSERMFDIKSNITTDLEIWKNFLDTSSNLYKLKFDEQIMIYAENPKATACATYDVWNDKTNRFVKKGSKGIPIVYKDENNNFNLKYYFDITSTNTHFTNKEPYIWSVDKGFENDFITRVEQKLNQIPITDDYVGRLLDIGEVLVYKLFNNNDINLENKIDQDTFLNAMITSVQYSILKRCGVDTSVIDQNRFKDVLKINSPNLVDMLGYVTSKVSNKVLVTMGNICKNNEKLKQNEINQEKTLDNSINKSYTIYTPQFSTLKQETIHENKEEIEDANRTRVQTMGRLHSSRPRTRTTRTTGEIWENEGQISQGELPNELRNNGTRLPENAQSNVRSTESSRPNDGRNVTENDDSRRLNGTNEGHELRTLGGDSEQSQELYRGDNIQGDNLRQTITTPPKMEEQIEQIAQKLDEQVSSSFSHLEEVQDVEQNPDTTLDEKSKIIPDERTVMFSELGNAHKRIIEFTNIDDHEINVHTDEKGKEIALFFEQHDRRTPVYNALEIDKETDNFKLLAFIDDPKYLNFEIGDEIIKVFEELPESAIDEIYTKANDMFPSIQELEEEIQEVDQLQEVEVPLNYDVGDTFNINLYNGEKQEVIIDVIENDNISLTNLDGAEIGVEEEISSAEFEQRLKDGVIEPIDIGVLKHLDISSIENDNIENIENNIIDKIEISLLASEKLPISAKNNTKEDFEYAFKDEVIDIAIKMHDNKEIMSNQENREFIYSLLNDSQKALEFFSSDNFYEIFVDRQEPEYTKKSSEEKQSLPVQETEILQQRYTIIENEESTSENNAFLVLDNELGFVISQGLSNEKAQEFILNTIEINNKLKGLEDLVGENIEYNGRKYKVEYVDLQINKVSLFDLEMKNVLPISQIIAPRELLNYLQQNKEKSKTPKSKKKQDNENQVNLFDFSHEEPNKLESEILIDFDGGSLTNNHEIKVEPKEINTNQEKVNFKITNDELGEVGAKEKFKRNILAIETLKTIESENRIATPEEQEILSNYVGFGGLADAFNDTKSNWSNEFTTLKNLLTENEYESARATTLNAHYTPPIVIESIYQALEDMGVPTNSNILDPALGIGNFMGKISDEFSNSNLYGVELDDLTGRIAKQLYPNSNIEIKGFEETTYEDNFFDVAVGNVPFGDYPVSDKKYDKDKLNIHDYFFVKTLDKVREGGIVAFVTSKGTMDKINSIPREMIANKADLLGAVRLPNTTFSKNAGTEVTTDIIFLQKRTRPPEVMPEWTKVSKDENGFNINNYFIENPHMIMGKMEVVTGRFGDELVCKPNTETSLKEQLSKAIRRLDRPNRETLEFKPQITQSTEENAKPKETISAIEGVKNHTFALVDDKIYYRENSKMILQDPKPKDEEIMKSVINLRDKVQDILKMQRENCTDDELKIAQGELNQLYNKFAENKILINSKSVKKLFKEDVTYPLLCAIEVLDDNKNLIKKADIFEKRTIQASISVTSVDNSQDALAVSISEKACVDIEFMANLMGGQENVDTIIEELKGQIFKDPLSDKDDKLIGWKPADEYLSGNVREKLAIAKQELKYNPDLQINVDILEKVQPPLLKASEIDVRIGATWIDEKYYRQFMFETFQTPLYKQSDIKLNYLKGSNKWSLTGKGKDKTNPIVCKRYGTSRMNAFEIFEKSINLTVANVYDRVPNEEGKMVSVYNKKESTIALQKQELISDAFKDWIFADPTRRSELEEIYNQKFNAIRPREFDGQYIKFDGMNPEIKLRTHQRNAVARTIYGENTMLAHCVGAGKTYTMIASAMESKRIGLCSKSMITVPNHLTEQMGEDVLKLYPDAKVLVAKTEDFKEENRKKFCSKIATGDFDIVVIGHSQFQKLPLSTERQEQFYRNEIKNLTDTINEWSGDRKQKHNVKDLEKLKKKFNTKLKNLMAEDKKDNVVTFEDLGIDRLFVDEADLFKNLYLNTKMGNVAGLSTSASQKATDMYSKTKYIDEITGGKGVIFATGTPISNSMSELFTMMRYLQMDTLKKLDLTHFDSWATLFGEKETKPEIKPEGTGLQLKTRFSKFFNLPELMNTFKGVADIQTADMIKLPIPNVEEITVVTQATEFQKEIVKDFGHRADAIRQNLVEPKVDNMLKVTGEGRKMALDQRLLYPNLPDDPNSKVNACVDNVFNLYEETKEDKLTQMIFCDMSTPKAKSKKTEEKDENTEGEEKDENSVNSEETEVEEDDDELSFEDLDEQELADRLIVYGDIKDKLIKKGVDPNEIAFIHDAKTDEQKAILFKKVREGKVRVLIGSTAKLGAGTNAQNKLIGLHHLDCPWRPRDLEQREGRIIRQGNENEQVKIFKYVTEGTFDSYNWSLLEKKQKFIGQIFTSKTPMRSADDIDATALGYAETMSVATGDPRFKEKMELDIEVAKLTMLKSNHKAQCYTMQNECIAIPTEINKIQTNIGKVKNDISIVKSNPMTTEDFKITIKGEVFTDRTKAGEKILELSKTLKSLGDKVELGEYRGFKIDLYKNLNTIDVQVNGAMQHFIPLDASASGNITRINNGLEKFTDNLKNLETKVDELEKKLDVLTIESAKPFQFEYDLKNKKSRLNKLNIELEKIAPKKTNAIILPIEERLVNIAKMLKLNPIEVKRPSLKSKIKINKEKIVNEDKKEEKCKEKIDRNR